MDYYSFTHLTELRERLDRCTDSKEREILENDIEQIQEFLHDWMLDSGQWDP